MKRILPLLALFVLPAVADEPAAAAPAPAAVEAAPESAVVGEDAAAQRPERKVRPGPAPRGREMTPEMKSYVDRLEKIRVARDEQARIAAQAAKDIADRKEALAAENGDVKALVDKIAELGESLAVAEKSLAELYAADEKLAALETKKADAEKERDARQREMHSAIAAAMDERAARFHGSRHTPGTPAKRAPAPVGAPAPDASSPADPSAAPAPASPAPAAAE